MDANGLIANYTPTRAEETEIRRQHKLLTVARTLGGCVGVGLMAQLLRPLLRGGQIAASPLVVPMLVAGGVMGEAVSRTVTFPFCMERLANMPDSVYSEQLRRRFGLFQVQHGFLFQEAQVFKPDASDPSLKPGFVFNPYDPTHYLPFPRIK
eukprot:TRINITY_DN13027_c1_g1_i1.p2 TRINITY_DN13027_c1_g1~~TRINITY_DN13027_c1_g1_i1.p2  ORF type:complete len:162 (-),score=29.10 TRINITY_DN13027_c1_g1_i1:333-788(-)